MFKSCLLRQVSRASTTAVRPPTPFSAPATAAARFPGRRTFNHARILRERSKDDPKQKDEQLERRHDEYSTAGTPGAFEHEGQFSRTDNTIRVEYPDEPDLPKSKPVQGRGSFHFKRTLASFSLEDRVGLVTGGARGLGLVMSQALVVSGADVAIVDLNSTFRQERVLHAGDETDTAFTEEEAQRQAEVLMKDFRDTNPGSDKMPKVTAHYADVSSPDSVNAAIKEILDVHGKIDNLVTSAGFTENFDAISYPHDRIQKLWGVNVDGTYLFATGVARHLIERGAPGSIVFIGSMSGAIVNVPQPQAPYNAAKAAVRHLASSLAVEWAHAGIRVNCISPGYMLTAL